MYFYLPILWSIPSEQKSKTRKNLTISFTGKTIIKICTQMCDLILVKNLKQINI